jgi:hypothetical protein
MTHIEADDETVDYSCGYIDGVRGKAANCPAGMDEDLYEAGYEAGQEASSYAEYKNGNVVLRKD